jgi:hypothetical protein
MPRGVPERTARTCTTVFLRVPSLDWPKVVTGEKRELRTMGRYALMAGRIRAPELVVGYLVRRYDERREQLLIVDDAWQEPLGAISPQSLAAEGFESFGEFRSYWKLRFPRSGWRPLSTVQVCTLRPFTPADHEPMAERLLQRIYGRWLA